MRPTRVVWCNDTFPSRAWATLKAAVCHPLTHTIVCPKRPNDASLRAMRELDEGKGTRYADGDAMLRDILGDDWASRQPPEPGRGTEGRAST